MTIEEFDMLPRNKKKVLVAQDALGRLISEQYVPRSSYFSLKQEISTFQVKELVLQGTQCGVCVRGAILLSLAGFINDLDVFSLLHGSFDKDGNCTQFISKIFSIEEQDILENAYEYWGRYEYWRTMIYSKHLSNTPAPNEPEFNQGKYRRMYHLLSSIVENDGDIIIPEPLKQE